MSRLATEYLQKSCNLPRQVESIEADLANGFLLVALMNQMGYVTEEEYEEVNDVPNPDAVLNNFRILARTLRKLDISLTRKDVANIVSETPGSSAQLVMKIRKVQEARKSGKKSKLNEQPAFKSIIKSARPKEFVRHATTVKEVEPAEEFFTDARSVLSKGVFAELDMRCHLSEFYQTEFKNRNKGVQQDVEVTKSSLDHRTLVHDTIAANRKDTRINNTLKDAGVTARWIVTEEDKRKRQVRDLQFELATVKIDELRRKKRSNTHRVDQIKGIDAFEVNLKRSGIGGGDDGGELSTTYEDSELFSHRLASTAQKNWPTDDETGDFMTQLQIRTKDNRVARYEKDRRRRRMLVEQAAANNTFIYAEDDMELAKDLAATAELEMKATMKATRLQEAVENGAKSREVMMEAAEEKIKEFSETFASRAEEIDAERRENLKNILATRENFEQERLKENNDIVRSIVIDFVGDIFDADSGAKAKVTLDGSNPNVLVGQLLNIAVARCSEGKAIEGVDSLDAWACHAALGMNMGKWQRSIPSSSEPEPEPVTKESQSVEEQKGNEESEATGEIEPVQNYAPKKEEVPIITRQDSFLETAQTVLETIVQRSRESGTGGGSIPIDLSKSEQEHISTGTDKVVVALFCGFSPALSAWSQTVDYTGGRSCLWDSVSATLVGMKLKPLMEGKKPTVDFSSIVKICTDGTLECPESLAGTSLTPDVLNVCKDLVAISDKILALKEKAESEDGIAVADVAFSPISCAIAIGQSLWLRQFVREKLADVENIDKSLPRLIFASRLFGAACSFDNAIFSRVIDHFLQGGTRDDIPETEEELTEAIASDGGGSGKGKKPAKKGKGEPEVIEPRVAIAAVAWFHADATRPFDSTLPQLKKPVFIEGEDNSIEEQVRYYLNAADVANMKEAVPENTLLTCEKYLLKYGVAAVPEGMEPLKPANIVAKIPIYSLLNPLASTVAEAPVEPVAEGEESSDEPALVSQLESHLEVTKDLACTETILSIILNIYGNDYGFVVPDVVVVEEEKEAVEDESAEIATAIGTVSAILTSHSKVSHIKASRRFNLNPENQVWLLHLVGENPLEMDQIFDIHGQISNARAVEIELKGLLVMIMSYSMSCIEDEVRRQQTGFVHSLKNPDSRWYDFCAEAMRSLNGCLPEEEQIIYEDLMCTIGNIIDDRHMRWLSNLTQIEDNGSSAVLDLQKVLLDVTELFARASFEILEVQKDAALALSGWLSQAKYSQVPWVVHDSESSESKSNYTQVLNDSIKKLHGSCVLAENSGRERANALWGDIINMELPSAADVGSIESTSLSQLHEEMISSCHSAISSAVNLLQCSRDLMLDSLNDMKANAKRRYAYEHEVLVDWGSQLRGEDTKPDAPSGKQFLHQFHFGVSDDVVNDQVTFLNGQNQVEVGDMQLNLQVLKVFSEEISAVLLPGTESNTNSGASIADKHLSVIDAICDTISLAVKKCVQKGVVIPRAWRNMKRLQNFTASFITSQPTSDMTEAVKIALRDMFVTLLHAATPVAPTVEYILRLVKILGKTAPGSDLIELDSSSDPLDVDALVKRALADTKLQAGWWELKGDSSITMKEILESYFSIVANSCLDSAGNVVMVPFFLSFCKCPSIHSVFNVEDILCFSNERNIPATADSKFSILSTGLYKAVMLSSKVSVTAAAGISSGDHSSSHTDTITSEGTNKLQSILGKSASIDQLNWLSHACGGKAVVPSASNFRAHIAKSKLQKNIKPSAIQESTENADKTDENAEEEGKSATEEAPPATEDAAAPEPDESSAAIEVLNNVETVENMNDGEEEEEEEWSTVDTVSSGMVLQSAMSWCTL
jgi:hypothetical protein